MQLLSISKRLATRSSQWIFGEFPQLYFNHQSSARLKSICAGKTIAIVGSSPDLLGVRMGSLIDQHDVVVRINLLDPGLLEAHLGQRTDIRFLGSTLSDFHFKNFQLMIGKSTLISSEKNRPLLSSKQLSVDYFHRNLPMTSFEIFRRLGWKYRGNTPLVKPPRSGLVALALFLSHSYATQISLFGFSRSTLDGSQSINYLSQEVTKYSTDHMERNHCSLQTELTILDYLEATGVVSRLSTTQDATSA